ncbi:MAG: tRNA (adenosine(37)-N6)-dimethylallyltransferase MiaA [Desulfocapsa sp.]|nr:MAG: tRNA (adenosine(37)-N6)-dimethylallyltransferase MiaA [Desulfocapsa sp.]
MERISFPSNIPILTLIGPTAIGKTELSIKLAKKFDMEIISVDSMQVYRHMDIGTAKISREEMAGIPHHLIDVVSPDQNFDAVTFEQQALDAIRDISARGRRVLLTGGTGLYLKSLLEGLSHKIPKFPEIRKEIQKKLATSGRHVLHDELMLIDCDSAKRIHVNDTHRLVRALEIYKGTGKAWSQFLEEHKQSRELRFTKILTIGLTCDRQLLYERIELRSNIMMANGFEQEVKDLLKRGYGVQHKSMRSIGYSHMTKYLAGEWDTKEMLTKLTRDTRRYAKRQYTWFGKIKDIEWVEKTDVARIPGMVDAFFHTT